MYCKDVWVAVLKSLSWSTLRPRQRLHKRVFDLVFGDHTKTHITLRFRASPANFTAYAICASLCQQYCAVAAVAVEKYLKNTFSTNIHVSSSGCGVACGDDVVTTSVEPGIPA